MTTNKPGVTVYEPSEKGATVMRKASFRNIGPDRYVRLSDYEALQAECERLRKDAERYRWLRDGNGYYPEENYLRGGVELDDAIDAARQEPNHDNQ